MKTVYAKQLPDVPYIPLLYPNLGVQERDSIMFLNNAFSHLKEPLVKLTDTPEEADAIVLAHNYSSLKKHTSFVAQQAQLAQKLGKPFIVFWHGDSDAAVPYKNATVIRTSQYRSAIRSNEVIMPAYAADLLTGELNFRHKEDRKPSLGFCGWADYKNVKNRIGTILKNSLVHSGARIKGITFRMKALHYLQSSQCIHPNFIIRSSYSGHRSTIKTNADQARTEYIDNMLNSDYALVIKGDGNYSYRFYEALSLGRIPVLLDTECVLPMEDVIQYDNFVLRVPYQNLHHLDSVVAKHYASTSDQDFVAMQQQARDVFEKYLRVDAFLHYAVNHYFV